MNNYMHIAQSIPQMEMKADPQAQAWAHSAHNILVLTSESIAETLLLTNQTATSRGTPFFCLPAMTTLNSEELNNIIQQTYRDISSQQSDKGQMTVSQVALLGVSKKYPCKNKPQ